MGSLILILLMMMQTQPNQEYMAKRGDTVTITVWERESLSGTVIIDSNGNITLPMPIGSVQVVGKTATQISQMLTDRLKEYSINPTVFVSISPSEGFNVHVLGEVKTPNFFNVPEGTTVQEVIAKSGGLTDLADDENIRLIRLERKADGSEDNKVEMIVNFKHFVEQNDLTANPVLKSDDVLFVPRVPKSEIEEYKYIAFFGAVNAQGIKEIEEPLPLVRAIALAGGLSDIALAKEISIVSLSDGEFTRKNVDFEKFLKDGDKASNPIVKLGDMIFVPTKPEDEPPITVSVIGQVSSPGKYPVKKGSRVLDAIYEAGGFIEDAFIDDVSVIRIDPDDLTTTKYSVNIKDYLASNDLNFNPTLTEGDMIFVPISQSAKIIPPIQQAFISFIRVSIIGEVNKAGEYQVSTKSNVLDIIKVAEGYTSLADMKKVTIIRESSESGKRKSMQTVNIQKILTNGEFQLLPELVSGDTIFIPQKPEGNVWDTIVRVSSQISTIAVAFFVITGRRWW